MFYNSFSLKSRITIVNNVECHEEKRFVEIAIYNNLIQRTKRGCITKYIYSSRSILYETSWIVGKASVWLFFFKGFFFLFSNDLCRFFLISQHCSSFVIAAHDLISFISRSERTRCKRTHGSYFYNSESFCFMVDVHTAFAPFVLRQMARCEN